MPKIVATNVARCGVEGDERQLVLDPSWFTPVMLLPPVDYDPAEGCNGCGMCCCKGPCMVFLALRPIPKVWPGRCPELLWDGHRHWCGLYRWRKLLHRLGALDGPKQCIHPGNSWKRAEEIIDRTAHPLPSVPDFQVALAKGLLDLVGQWGGDTSSEFVRLAIENFRKRLEGTK